MSRRIPWHAPSAGLRAHGRAGGRARRLLALFAALLLAAGCMEANPLPSPGAGIDTRNGGEPGGNGDQTDGRGEPGVDPGKYAYIEAGLTFVSSLVAGEDEGTVVVVGAPGATAGGVEIEVAIEEINFSARVPRAADGGFAREIQHVRAGLEIEITLLDDDEGADASGDLVEVGEPLKLTVREVSVGDPSFFYDRDSNDPDDEPAPAGEGDPAWAGGDGGAECADASFITVGTPDADGVAHVRSGCLGVTPYATVLVLNMDTERSFAGQADSAGGLDIPVDAEVGHELLVFAANPLEPAATTEAITLIVPRP